MNGRLAQLCIQDGPRLTYRWYSRTKKIKVEIYHFRNQLIIGRGDHDRRCIDPVHNYTLQANQEIVQRGQLESMFQLARFFRLCAV